jgi:chemotaxis protein MotB
MAGDAKKLQPIIIKRIKKSGHAAHGGAWKIAYADFVTAMMAFFLLMWLLGSTTEGDKKGIADYFSSPLKVALLNGGSGSGDASSLVKGGGTDLTRTGGQVKKGDIEAERNTINLQALKAEQAAAERARLEALKGRVEEVLANSPKLADFKGQIRLDMTREGLRIQIVDDQKRAMFDSGSPEVQPYMRELLRAIGSVLTEVPNKLTLEGHTDAKPMGSGLGYSNWELSSDRANARAGPGGQRALRPRRSLPPHQPAHQHHRHDAGCRGPLLCRRQCRRAPACGQCRGRGKEPGITPESCNALKR